VIGQVPSFRQKSAIVT